MYTFTYFKVIFIIWWKMKSCVWIRDGCIFHFLNKKNKWNCKIILTKSSLICQILAYNRLIVVVLRYFYIFKQTYRIKFIQINKIILSSDNYWIKLIVQEEKHNSALSWEDQLFFYQYFCWKRHKNCCVAYNFIDGVTPK